MNKLLAVLLLALSLPALAAHEVAGVKFEDTQKVGAGDTAIQNDLKEHRLGRPAS